MVGADDQVKPSRQSTPCRSHAGNWEGVAVRARGPLTEAVGAADDETAAGLADFHHVVRGRIDGGRMPFITT